MVSRSVLAGRALDMIEGELGIMPSKDKLRIMREVVTLMTLTLDEDVNMFLVRTGEDGEKEVTDGRHG